MEMEKEMETIPIDETEAASDVEGDLNTNNNSNVVVAGGGGGGSVVVIQSNKQQSSCRAAIPAMHIAMAVICCIFNVIFPGLGTIFAAFSVFCCANRDQSMGGKFGTMCLNFWIGWLQAGTVWIFFLGWVWSIMWGAAFIGMSDEYHNPPEDDTIIVANSAPPPAPVIVNTTMQMNAPMQQPMGQPGYGPPPQQGYGPPPQQGYGQPMQPMGQQPPMQQPPPYDNQQQQMPGEVPPKQ